MIPYIASRTRAKSRGSSGLSHMRCIIEIYCFGDYEVFTTQNVNEHCSRLRLLSTKSARKRIFERRLPDVTEKELLL
jgi:hypothetical protein